MWWWHFQHGRCREDTSLCTILYEYNESAFLHLYFNIIFDGQITNCKHLWGPLWFFDIFVHITYNNNVKLFKCVRYHIYYLVYHLSWPGMWSLPLLLNMQCIMIGCNQPFTQLISKHISCLKMYTIGLTYLMPQSLTIIILFSSFMSSSVLDSTHQWNICYLPFCAQTGTMFHWTLYSLNS